MTMTNLKLKFFANTKRKIIILDNIFHVKISKNDIITLLIRINKVRGILMKIKIKKINQNAKIPTRGTKDSAGYDLYACIKHAIKIQPHETLKIPIVICTEMIKNTVALVYSRSGLATKKGLVVCQGTGVIDSDYRGEWFVPIHNDTNKMCNGPYESGIFTFLCFGLQLFNIRDAFFII